jgi:hypothetical protein
MGLFVVGRLAARHGVRVRLRHAQAGGLTALIWLPETVAAPEVAPPLGRLRRFESDDYGPAPSLSAPTPMANPIATSQAAAAARIPRFSTPGPTSSPSFTPSGPGTGPQHMQPPAPPQQVPSLPVRNGTPSFQPTNGSAGTIVPPVSPATDEDAGLPVPSRLPSFGGQPASRGGDGLSAADIGGDNDLAATSSLPVVGLDGNGNGGGTGESGTITIPPAAAGDQRLPIFDSLESDWFRRSGKTLTANRPTQPAATQSTWTSPADEGWRAAQAVAAPSAGETTQAGLPKRVPRANLVPGSVGNDQDGAVSAAPARTPDDVRSRMSSFQRGVREGRAAAPQVEEQ